MRSKWQKKRAFPKNARFFLADGRRRRSGFVSGFSVAGVADPGRGAERLSERFLAKAGGRVRINAFGFVA
jgi:hypothetical protein